MQIGTYIRTGEPFICTSLANQLVKHTKKQALETLLGDKNFKFILEINDQLYFGPTILEWQIDDSLYCEFLSDIVRITSIDLYLKRLILVSDDNAILKEVIYTDQPVWKLGQLYRSSIEFVVDY
jgi:hypothetical protein